MNLLRLLTLIAVMLVSSALLAQEGSPLTTIQEIKRLSATDAARKMPVRLNATVTYFNPASREVFLLDDTGSIYAGFLPPGAQAARGDQVEVEGVTDLGGLAPMVHLSEILQVGRRDLPTAQSVTARMLVEPQSDAQRVTLEGIVAVTNAMPGGVSLRLILPDGPVLVFLYGRTKEAIREDLMGARVRVCGVSVPMVNHQRQVIAARVQVSPLDEFLVLETGRVDLAVLPVTSLSEVRQAARATAESRLIRVQGTVTAILNPLAFFLQDDSGGILVRSTLPVKAQPGDHLELYGHAFVTGQDVVFELGLRAELGRTELPSAIAVTPEDLAKGRHGASRVTFEAPVLSVTRDPGSEDVNIALQFGAAVVLAHGPQAVVNPQQVVAGSRVLLRGVLGPREGTHSGSSVVDVYLTRADDLIILAGPPPNRIWILLGILAVVVGWGSLALLWNMTLRRRVRARTADLTASREQLQAMLEALPDLMLRIDQEGRIHDQFFSATDRLDLARSDLLGRTVREVFPANAAEVILAALEEAVVNGQHRGATYSVPTPAGLAWYELSIAAMGRPTKSGQQFIALVRDITQRKQAEDDLRVSEERHRLLADIAVDNIWTMGLDRRFTFIAPSIEKLRGFTAAEMLQQSLEEVLTPDSLVVGLDYLDRLTACAQAGLPLENFRGELELQCKGGSTVWTEVIASPRRDAAGHVVELIGVTRDLTERKRYERDLVEAWEQAETANRAKGTFLANMSHEIRTPISVMLGYADILRDPLLPESEKAHAVQAICRNGETLLLIINDILDLAKIEAGKLEPDLQPYSPWKIVQEATAFLQVQAAEKGVRLVLRAAGRLPRTCTTDALRVKQILVNFLANAIKFTDAGQQVLVRLSAEPALSRLCFEVEDEGIGMSQEQLARLFQPFAQVDSSITRKYGGTGLGLSIAKRLSDALGGEIQVRTALGQGSLFRFLLPLGNSEETEWLDESEFTESLFQEGQTPLVCPPTLSGRVLLAEDSRELQKLLADHLRRAALDVEVAENGRVAVEKALQGGFDLILMDLQMPELDGYSATRRLRSSGYCAPIIALTAHALREEREQYADSGFTDYLTKPIRIETLLGAVAVHLPKQDVPCLPSTRALADQRGEDASNAVSVIEDEVDFRSLVRDYVRDLSQQAQALRAAVVSGDWQRLANLAHQIRGSAGMYDLPAVGETAGLLEEAAREQQGPSLLQELIDELEAAVEQARQDDAVAP